jgi:type II secretory pathway pseudopilin PulG
LRRHGEAGESLVEILIAIVIIGIVMGAIFATYATASTSAKSERDFVTADAVLRNYAEATEQAVRTTCTSGNPGSPFAVTYAPPSGYTVSAGAGQLKCPAVTTVGLVAITVTLPSGSTRTLSIDVRTP